MADIKTLLSIVRGGDDRAALDPRQEFARTQIESSETLIASFTDTMSPKDKYKEWLTETKNWYSHPDNTEYRWETEEKLFPGDDFRETVINKTNEDLFIRKTPMERTSYFRDKAPLWPKWLQDIYRDNIERDKSIDDARSLELSRVNNKLVTEEILRSITSKDNFALDGSVGKRIHNEDMYTALYFGYTADEINTVDGRVTVPLRGERVPVWTIDPEDYPSVDPNEQIILLKDTYNSMDRALSGHYNKGVSKDHDTANATSRKLFDSIGTMGDGFDPFWKNWVLDYAVTQVDPVAAINEGIDKKMKRDIYDHKFSSSMDAVYAYINYWTECLLTLEKRS